MIVQCDQCSAKYKLDDNKVAESGVKIRCKRCQHVFQVPKAVRREEPAPEKVRFNPRELPVPPELPGNREPVKPEQSEASDLSAPFFLPEETTATTFPDDSFEDEESFQFTLPSEPTAPEPEPPNSTPLDDFSFPFESGAAVLPRGADKESFPSAEEPLPPSSQPDDLLEFSFADDFPEDDAELVTPPAPPLETATEEVGWDEVDTPLPQPVITEKPAKSEPRPVPVKGSRVKPERERWAPEMDEINSVDFDTLSDELPEPEAPPAELPSPEDAAQEGGEITPAEPEAELLESPQPSPQEMETPESGDEPSLSEEQPANVPAPPWASSADDDRDDADSEAAIPASRRQGPSAIAILAMLLGGIILLLVGGVGALYLLEGPEALKKVGLGSLVRLLKADDKVQERVLIKNLEGSYINTNEGKELFVLRGEALNLYPTPHAAIQVRGLIYNSAGTVILERSSYCGNPLTPEQLATLPLAKIEAAMNNRLGDSYANIGVPPGKTVPFVIVFAGLPKDAADFGVEVSASQPVGELIIIK